VNGKRTSIQIEAHIRVFFFLVAVVVRPPFDDLHVAQAYAGAWGLWGYEAAERNYGGYGEGDGGEEAEDILQSHECGVHVVWAVRLLLRKEEYVDAVWDSRGNGVGLNGGNGELLVLWF
jgi:hypothetical protein